MKAPRPPDIVAKIKMNDTREGAPLWTRPNGVLGCPFEFQGKYFDCALTFAIIGEIPPGFEAAVPISFLEREIIMQQLKVGDEFTLWAGRTIGTGVVQEILFH